ncbi:hypothetical protein [Cellulomonas hominis]|uniref:hypothetical protein n=1 Tax=Cellulomonas hominis TaxID=156981 RepID=UPI001443ACAE|nr:hypothetical protein [Cellulomonas hominis]NKY08974.1 hypothetical protein [Cellulomonas hominis]
MTTFNTHRDLSELITESSPWVALDDGLGDRPDVYAITLRIACEPGSTDAGRLTEAITSAVAELDEERFGILVVQPDLTEPIDVRADSTSRVDAHRTTAECTEHHFRAW